MFNLIAARRSFDEMDVLDLFCGTGALGLEAISRGAATVTFVDVDREAVSLTRRNAELLGVGTQSGFLVRDARRFLRRDTASYDLIFADPPYRLNGLVEIPDLARARLRDAGFFFLEHDRHFDFEGADGWLESRKYGRTIVSIFGPEHDE